MLLFFFFIVPNTPKFVCYIVEMASSSTGKEKAMDGSNFRRGKSLVLLSLLSPDTPKFVCYFVEMPLIIDT